MTDRAPWYRWADMPPPFTVQTRWQWAGRIFVGIRGFNKKTGLEMLAEVLDDGRRRIVTGRGDTPLPHLWQPLHPHLWRAPLPDPVVLSTDGIMATTIQRFSAVDAASGIDRGMVSHETHKPSWHDHLKVRYEPKGSVTLAMAEARTMRAMACCGAGRGWQPRQTLTSDVLAVSANLMQLATAEIESGDVDAIPARFQPVPADYQDFEIAMGWVAALNPPEFWSKRRRAWSLSKTQRVLLWRSLPAPLSFAAIGDELGWSGHQRAQQVYAEGVEKVWRAANGLRMHKQLEPVDQIAALRERNRASKRREVA